MKSPLYDDVRVNSQKNRRSNSASVSIRRTECRSWHRPGTLKRRDGEKRSMPAVIPARHITIPQAEAVIITPRHSGVLARSEREFTASAE